MVYYDAFHTKWGDLFIAATDKGLCTARYIENLNLLTEDDAKVYTSSSHVEYAPEKLSQYRTQYQAYFEGTSKTFEFDFDLQGTDFQMTVWRILQTIPYGEVWSYQNVAIAAGDANKVRAVGGAVGKNPVIIAVPCHRVIGKNKKLTGFSSLGGTDLKKKILDHEGIDLFTGTDYQIPLI